MKKIFLMALALVALFAAPGCRRELDDFVPIEGTNHSTNILGLVVDENKQPIVGAQVVYMGQTKTTDDNGVYKFTNVEVNSRHSFVQISKPGYFEGSREFSAKSGTKTVNLRNMLLKKEFNYAFDGAAGGAVNEQGVTITFPASAIVVAASGAAYNGQVKVAMKYLDPSENEVYDQMPGSLSGISADQKLEALTTFGMIAVEMQSTSGEKLQIKSGQQAEISSVVPAALLEDAKPTIPLWYYDEGLGYWKEEGSATLVGNKYVGKVSHFTFWNYDSSLPGVVVSGTVVDQNGNPITGAHIAFTIPGEYGGQGWANEDGTFSGLVPSGVTLDVNVYTYNEGCWNQAIFTSQLGPFTEDTNIGDVVVTLTGLQTVTVTGNFLDCNGDPIQDGYAYYSGFANNWNWYNQSVNIVNGEATFTYVTCDPNVNLSITAVNLTEFTQSTPIIVTETGNVDLGDVTVCEEITDFITVVCTNLGLDQLMITPNLTTYVDSLPGGGGVAPVGKYIFAPYAVDGNIEYLQIYYDEVNPVYTFQVGTYNITNFGTYILNGAGAGGYYAPSGGTVTITQGGTALGDVVKGTYTVQAQIQGATTTETFTGEFSITIAN